MRILISAQCKAELSEFEAHNEIRACSVWAVTGKVTSGEAEDEIRWILIGDRKWGKLTVYLHAHWLMNIHFLDEAAQHQPTFFPPITRWSPLVKKKSKQKQVKAENLSQLFIKVHIKDKPLGVFCQENILFVQTWWRRRSEGLRLLQKQNLLQSVFTFGGLHSTETQNTTNMETDSSFSSNQITSSVITSLKMKHLKYK